MLIKIEITDQRINDLLTGHGGKVSTWLKGWDCQSEAAGRAKVKWRITARWDREEDVEGAGKGSGVFLTGSVRVGLELMAKKSPTQWAAFMIEDDDDITFDTIAQYIIFGKLVYA